jgi:hypothetical protein
MILKVLQIVVFTTLVSISYKILTVIFYIFLDESINFIKAQQTTLVSKH